MICLKFLGVDVQTEVTGECREPITIVRDAVPLLSSTCSLAGVNDLLGIVADVHVVVQFYSCGIEEALVVLDHEELLLQLISPASSHIRVSQGRLGSIVVLIQLDYVLVSRNHLLVLRWWLVVGDHRILTTSFAPF
jgi:hypothetical protein